MLNLQTLLVQPEDMPACAGWRRICREDALVAVNSWRWLGETWAGSDGGAWILPLTGRCGYDAADRSYLQSRLCFSRSGSLIKQASAVSDWSDPAQAQWLRDQGVSHIFVGKRGGFFDPAKLAGTRRWNCCYDRSGVFIFAVGEWAHLPITHCGIIIDKLDNGGSCSWKPKLFSEAKFQVSRA